MNQSQTTVAAEALVVAIKQYDGSAPSASSPVWRKVITESLGIKKLYSSRLNKILSEAETLGVKVIDDKFTIKNDDDTKPDDIEVVKKSNPEPAANFTKSKSPQYMGRLLESEIRGLSARLDDGQATTVTFCICPHCGKNLKMLGVAEGAYDSPSDGDMAE
jgi:hypothetical protein